jgi:hypothetical protein
MAGFTADLNPKTSTMSLADIMKAGAYGAEMEVLNRQAQVAREKEKELPVIQGFISDPKNKNERGEWDLEKVNTILPTIAPITGPDFAKKIMDGVQNHAQATKAKLELTNTARGFMASLYGSYAQAGTQDPKEVATGMANLGQQMPELRAYIEPALRNLQNVPPGPKFTESLFKARDEFLTPTQQIEAYSPKAGTTQVGNALFGTVTQPSFRGSQPTVSTSPLGGGQGSVTPTGGATTEAGGKPLPKLIQEDTSMSYTGPANPLNMNKFQEAAYATGQKNVTEANANKPILANMLESVRKVEDYINSAAGSKLGQMKRKGLKYVFSDPELDTTVKNLANLQARNSAIMGLDKTDSSRELNSKLSGSVDIAPEALAGVMKQVKAETKAAEQYIAGVNKFVEKRGDVNGYIQEQKFQRKWAEHYDPRIFQVDDIASSKLPENEKITQIGQITGRMTKPEFEKYKEDRQIINRLAKGLYQ